LLALYQVTVAWAERTLTQSDEKCQTPSATFAARRSAELPQVLDKCKTKLSINNVKVHDGNAWCTVRYPLTNTSHFDFNDDGIIVPSLVLATVCCHAQAATASG
jgi:hypothetical protein